MPDAGFDAALQLLLALSGLLHSIAAFLLLLSSYIALCLFVVLCVAMADLIYRAASRISAHSAKAVLVPQPAVARFHWKSSWRSKATHA